MKITQAFLVFLLGLSTVNCACGEGTLQCSSDDVPLVCDFTSSYVLNEAGDGCEKKTVEGCEVMNPENAANDPCLLCEKKKVLDTEKTKCVDVAADSVKENCERYDQLNSACVSCEENYFISSGSCVPVGDVKVDNCMVYSSATACQTCNSGYYLNGTSCDEITTVANCYAHTAIKCDSCLSGFILNAGLNSEVTVNSSLNNSIASGGYSSPIMNTVNTQSVCQAEDVTNCTTFETFDKCSVCDSLYMLTPEKKCLYYPEDPIANCAIYSDNVTCTKCKDTHYLQTNACVERVADANCETWNVSADTCQVCKATFYLTNVTTPSVTTLCAARTPSTYKNCSVEESASDICNTCETGFTKTTDNKACLMDPANCTTKTIAATYNDIKHLCTACVAGYLLDSDACSGTLVDNCATYTPNTNTCLTCDSGYYLDGNTCPAQNVTDCEAGFYEANKNQCNQCVSLKKPSGATDPNTCVDISNSNCAASNGTNDDCTSCVAGYILDSNACDTARTTTPLNCATNTGATDLTGCATCDAGFVLATGLKPYATDDELNALNCLAIDKTNANKCKQCKDNFFLTAAFTCTDLTASAAANMCTRQNPGYSTATDLMHESDCEVCNSALEKVSVSGSCVNYSYSNRFNCSVIGDGLAATSTCKTCEIGTLIENSLFTCATVTSGGAAISIANCQIYSAYNKCIACTGSNVPSSDNSSCEAINTSTHESFSPAFDFIGTPLGTVGILKNADITTCVKFSQNSEGNIVCVQCGTDEVGILDDAVIGYVGDGGTAVKTPMFDLLYSGFEGTTEFNNHTTYNGFVKCVAKTAVLGENASKFDHASGTCAAGIMMATVDVTGTDSNTIAYVTGTHGPNIENKYACVSCRSGEVGTLGTITMGAEGAAYLFKVPLIHVKSCAAATAASDPTSTGGQGFGYKERFNNTMLSWNNFFRASTCSDANSILFYHVMADTSATTTLPFKYTTTSTNTHECVLKSNLDLTATTGGANCAVAIYKSTATPLATINASTAAECVACKPGFSATVTAGVVSACTAITNCTNASGAENQYLDACVDSSLPYTSTDLTTTVDTDNLIEVNFDALGTALADCKVVDGNNKCLICDNGFSPSSDGSSCVALTLANTGCSGALGVGETRLVKTATTPTAVALADSNKQFLNLMQIRMMNSNFNSLYKTNTTLLCAVGCDNSKIMISNATATEDRLCGLNPMSTAFTETVGCSQLNFNNTGCQTCASTDEIPNKSVIECVTKVSKPNCTVVDGASQNCTECDPGYVVDNNACVQSNCLVSDPSSGDICLVCNEFSRKHATNNKLCLPATTEDQSGKCKHFHGTKDLCIECVDAGHIPYNFKENSVVGWQCIAWAKSGAAELGYTMPYLYLNSDFSSGSTIELAAQITPSWAGREYANHSDGLITGEQNCLPGRTVANCGTMSDNVICRGCEAMYYLTESNECSPVTVPNCVETNGGADDCFRCESTHFLENVTTCTQRSNSTNCSDQRINLDKCNNCDAESTLWFDSSDSLCKPYTATNCATFAPSSDNCATCEAAFFATGTGTSLTCGAVTSVDNCKTYSNIVNQCDECNDGFWYDTSSTPACPARTTIEFCETTPLGADTCTSCEGDRYYNATSKECRDYPVGTANCAVYEYPDKCTLCDTGFFMDSTACSAVTTAVTGCAVHDSATTCQTCLDTHIANGDACDLIVVKTGCIKYSDKDTCSECSGKYFLENGACVDSGITGCSEAVKGTPNTCTTCDAGRFVNTDKTACTLGTAVSGCAIYKDASTCTMCASGKMMNADGTTCTTLTNQAGSNCGLASTLATPACDSCMLGYEKDSSGACVALSASNCYVQNSAGTCVMCTPKTHWMNKDGACEAVPEPPCTGDDCESQSILKFSFTFMLAFFILRLF